MLIGAHVSAAGGLVKAHERGVELGCSAIQVFNQSPRQWRPTRFRDADLAAFRELMANGPIESLVHALRLGDAIDADGVVIHPGSALKEPKHEAMQRAGDAFGQVLSETDRCSLLLEDTAGGGATIGRSFSELAELIELGGAGERLGLCLDCCHMYASGFDISTADKLTGVVDECVGTAGLDRVRCLHVNDSKTPLGSNSDRHAPLGTGELGPRGCAAFLSEPRFDGLPALFEGPGFDGKAPTKADVDRMKQLRRQGRRSRRRRKRRA